MKISKTDRVAMNLLYKKACECNTDQVMADHKSDVDLLESLLKEEGKEMKLAAKGEDIQAFKDHAEYVATLESVLKEDDKNAFDPNDMIMD